MANRLLYLEGLSLILLIVLAPVLTAGRLDRAMAGFETAPATVSTDETDVLYERSFAVRDGQALDVHLGSGDVRVQSTAGPKAWVVVTGTGRDAHAEFRRIGFTADVRDGRLVVQNRPSGRASGARLVYTIRVPRDLAAHANRATTVGGRTATPSA